MQWNPSRMAAWHLQSKLLSMKSGCLREKPLKTGFNVREIGAESLHLQNCFEISVARTTCRAEAYRWLGSVRLMLDRNDTMVFLSLLLRMYLLRSGENIDLAGSDTCSIIFGRTGVRMHTLTNEQ